MTPTWTDDDLIRAAKTRPLTAERLAKVQKRCSAGQWERIKARLQQEAIETAVEHFAETTREEIAHFPPLKQYAPEDQ